MKIRCLLFLFSVCALPAQATVVATYDSMVAPLPGTAGAADPATQGFTFVGSANQFASGFDSGNGGWRTVDGTSSAPAHYETTLSAEDVSALLASPIGWTLNWTAALDEDAFGSAGGFVDDYYLAPNQGRQNNNGIWFELAGNYRYIITHGLDASNQITLSDGTNTFNTGVSATDFPQFVEYSLVYDGTDATLDWGGGSAAVTVSGSASQDRLIFGAHSSSGQGSVVYNQVALAIPEPSQTVLLLLAGVCALGLRRR